MIILFIAHLLFVNNQPVALRTVAAFIEIAIIIAMEIAIIIAIALIVALRRKGKI